MTATHSLYKEMVRVWGLNSADSELSQLVGSNGERTGQATSVLW